MYSIKLLILIISFNADVCQWWVMKYISMVYNHYSLYLNDDFVLDLIFYIQISFKNKILVYYCEQVINIKAVIVIISRNL